MFSKISVVTFIRVISPATYNAKATLGLFGLIAAWAITSLVVMIFQCQVPQVWKTISNKCIDRDTFWAYSNSVNIIIDLMLIGLPMVLVWKLQIARSRKFVVVGCFAARAL
jgi:hypothetical protein